MFRQTCATPRPLEIASYSCCDTTFTVERITLRSVALRHHNGPLHFVPYGSLGTVRNTSRDWVIDKFNLPLPLEA